MKFSIHLLGVYIFLELALCVAQPFRCPPSFPCCKCQPVTLEVKCNSCKLTQVPGDLPSTTKWLILNFNQIRNLTDMVFAGVPLITHLELAANKIQLIGSSTFKHLPHLSFLAMSANPILPKVIEANVFCVLPRNVMNTLIFKQMHKWKIMAKNHFQCLQNTTLEVLDLSSNPAALSVENDTFANLKHLKTVIIQQTSEEHFNVFAYENDSWLNKLDLSHNKLYIIPTFAKLVNGSYKPVLCGLETLDLSDNRIFELEARLLHGLQNLKTLILSDNHIQKLGHYVIHPLTSLQSLNLQHNEINSINPNAFNSSTLLHLYLQYNRNFVFHPKHKNVFRTCPKIQSIFIDRTSFTSPNIMEDMFQNMSTLRVLSIRGIDRLNHIPKNTFCGLHNLTTLNLGDNFITNIDWYTFRDLTNIKKLYLTSNRIKNINETNLPNHVWDNLNLLDVSNNRFFCNCELFWFIDWVLSNKGKVNNLNATFCETSSMIKKTILQGGITITKCIYKPLSTGIISSFWLSTGIVLVTLLYSALMHFKWHIHTWIFKLGLFINSSRITSVGQHKRQQVEYTFDVFVCYNSEDRDWVKNVLLPELEEKSDTPFRVCEYDRNWAGGHSMINCIEESIQCSRKILLIVTNAFTESEWCQFELLAAQQNLLHQGNDNVILAIMEEIEPQNMTPNLFLEMKRKKYLEWTDEEVGRHLFFCKLKHSLQEPNSCLFKAMPDPQLIHSN